MADKEKKQKKTILKDFIWDYYKTNRKITKEYEEAWQEEERRGGKKRGWTGTEKMYLAVIVVGLALLAVKYVIF